MRLIPGQYLFEVVPDLPSSGGYELSRYDEHSKRGWVTRSSIPKGLEQFVNELLFPRWVAVDAFPVPCLVETVLTVCEPVFNTVRLLVITVFGRATVHIELAVEVNQLLEILRC